MGEVPTVALNARAKLDRDMPATLANAGSVQE